MSRKCILLGYCLLAVAMTSAQNQEVKKAQHDSLKSPTQLQEVVVTGTKFEIPVETSGKSIYTLSKESIKKNAGKSVVDLLNEVPGIQMEGNFGAPGTNVGTFVRGGRNKNTLILIDGVPLNDPSGIAATYDLRLLPINQIESIEVFKGGLSTLYGTGASAAVINIKLKESANTKLAGSVDANYGSYQTKNISANINGKLHKFSYLVSGNYLKSEGFSAALPRNNDTGFDKDGIDSKNILTKWGYQFTDQLKLDATIAFDEFTSEYDKGAFTDAENEQNSKMLRVGLAPTYTYKNGTVELKTVYATNERKFISSSISNYKGKNLQVDLTNKHRFNSQFTALWGVNLQKLKYQQADVIPFDLTDFTITDPYVSLFYQSNHLLTIHAGVRLNTHSEYGSKLIYNFNPSYLINLSQNTKIKLFSSLSTSYITPTGFQLFSIYGNTGLKPEESFNIEWGASLYVGKNTTFNAAYFDREETNPIDFVYLFDGEGNYTGGLYKNLTEKRKVNGLEMDATHQFSEAVALLANYTYINNAPDKDFYRIPKHKIGATLNVDLKENTSIAAKYNFTGKRTIFSSSSAITLADYSIFDLYAQHLLLQKKLTLYGAVNNLLDKDFVSIYGFTTRGRNYNLGLRYSF